MDIVKLLPTTTNRCMVSTSKKHSPPLSDGNLFATITAHQDWPSFQIDVVTAFLNGTLNDPVFMTQPSGCVTTGQHHLVCHLKKSLYGLCHSPRAWYSRIDSFLCGKGLHRTAIDPNVCYSRTASSTIILA